LKIPTGWIEQWRMPIEREIPAAPFDLKITGYLPYVIGFRPRLDGGGAIANPTIQVRLGDAERVIERTLLALDPKQSISDVGVPIEFRWANTPEEANTLLAPLAGTHELTMEIKEPPLTKVVAIEAGQEIKIEEAGYSLRVASLQANWPLMSKGFEGAMTPVAMIDVVGPTKSFQRTVVQRFPHLSQDIDEQGVRRREGLYDPNIELRYRGTPAGWLMIVAGPDYGPMLGVFSESGQVQQLPLERGRLQQFDWGEGKVAIGISGFERNALLRSEPQVEQEDRREPSLGREASAIRVELVGKGKLENWSESGWIPFDIDPAKGSDPDAVMVVRLPGEETEWHIRYGPALQSLGLELAGATLTTNYKPGGRDENTWRSDFTVIAPAGGSQRNHVATNDTCVAGEWTLFQSGAARDGWSFTVLGVGNRQGIWPMLMGSVLVVLGSLFAFYVKPVIIRARQKRALRRAAERSAASYVGEVKQVPTGMLEEAVQR
jgi:hypothetical protein